MNQKASSAEAWSADCTSSAAQSMLQSFYPFHWSSWSVLPDLDFSSSWHLHTPHYMISAVSYYTIKQTALLDEKLLFFQFFIIFKTLQKPTELTGSDGSCQWFLRFLDFEFSMFKSLDEQPEAVAFIIENLDAISRSVGKDKKAVIKDIHLELGMHNECQPIYRLAHIHEMRWNVDILDFISVDDHLRAPMILSRSAGSNSIQWPSMVIDTLGWASSTTSTGTNKSLWSSSFSSRLFDL